jgi:DUF2971 family protein
MLTNAQIRDRMYATMEVLDRQRPPAMLFHYTNHAGLIGIASSKELWATHLRFFNDNREVEDGISYFERAIDLARKDGQLGRLDEPFDIWHKEGGLLFAVSVGMYAACLSEKGDDLSQWRAYGVNGGYALGFDGPILARTLERTRLGELRRVVYEPSAKESTANLVVRTASELWKEIRNLPGSIRPKRRAELNEMIEVTVMGCIAVFKDPAFEEEAEWRIVASGELSEPGAVRYRVGKSSVIPYVAMPVLSRRERLLSTAIVGPSPDPQLTQAGMGECLVDAGFNAKEAVSNVPYRSW